MDQVATKAATELPDPEQFPGRDVVVFDGHCNFCRGGVGWVRRFDKPSGRLAFLSLHDERVKDLCPNLTYDQLMDQMYVIDTSGEQYGGADAVRYLTRRLPLLWPAAPILHLPGTANLWRWLYHQVASRRYKIAGRSCDSGTCRIH